MYERAREMFSFSFFYPLFLSSTTPYSETRFIYFFLDSFHFAFSTSLSLSSNPFAIYISPFCLSTCFFYSIYFLFLFVLFWMAYHWLTGSGDYRMNDLQFAGGTPQCPPIRRSQKLPAQPISLRSEQSVLPYSLYFCPFSLILSFPRPFSPVFLLSIFHFFCQFPSFYLILQLFHSLILSLYLSSPLLVPSSLYFCNFPSFYLILKFFLSLVLSLYLSSPLLVPSSLYFCQFPSFYLILQFFHSLVLSLHLSPPLFVPSSLYFCQFPSFYLISFPDPSSVHFPLTLPSSGTWVARILCPSCGHFTLIQYCSAVIQ
jgi:hypothetical protein